MGFNKQNLPTCPKCKADRLITIQSKQVTIEGFANAMRRRRCCDSCGFRDTTYEVSSNFYENAKANQQILAKIQSLLGGGKTVTIEDFLNQIPCETCSFSTDSDCNFSLPEYFTTGAIGCNFYEKSHD